MERTVTIGGIPCRLKTSAALPRIYRKLYNRDIFADVGLLGALDGAELTSEAYAGICEVIENLAFVMHRHGDPTQPEEIETWLAQFPDPGDVLGIADAIIGLWVGETAQTSEPEKKTDRSTAE